MKKLVLALCIAASVPLICQADGNIIGGSNPPGGITITSTTLPSGSTNYIQNGTSFQTGSVFNVSSGTVTGAVNTSSFTVISTTSFSGTIGTVSGHPLSLFNNTTEVIYVSTDSKANASGNFIAYAHVASTGTKPSIGTFGTGTPTISGTDVAGTLLANTGSPVTGNVVFSSPWLTAPICNVNSNFGAIAWVNAINVSSFTFTMNVSAGSGQGIIWHCIGLEK